MKTCHKMKMYLKTYKEKQTKSKARYTHQPIIKKNILETTLLTSVF